MHCFSCDSLLEVVSLRAIFLEKLFTTAPSLCRRLDEENSAEFFKFVLYERSRVALLAKFAYKVLMIFLCDSIVSDGLADLKVLMFCFTTFASVGQLGSTA
jgi:hypothetical protein